jgi:uncharacterized membrane protein YqhA
MVELFLSLRFLMLLASLGAVAGALLMFWLGGAKLLHAAGAVVSGSLDPRTTTTDVMGATDAFLFAMVLVIFASTIAFGFVFERGVAGAHLPEWMRVGSLRELKHTLIEVILVYLVVDTATDLAAAEELSWPALIKPATVLAIAGALRLMAATEPVPRDGAESPVSGPMAQ